ncbi:hypothetical protein [Paenibacillus sp. UMB4589-SE434]|uniref:hypothetical protein n=1 Tax=Paenibacillus sp. UMB4589-SE434 TaxID=3046314 RepID=UPI00254C0E4B|nr:hypothetical protein [Paenibacillus sp. UMB4589-SE434]
MIKTEKFRSKMGSEEPLQPDYSYQKRGTRITDEQIEECLMELTADDKRLLHYR